MSFFFLFSYQTKHYYCYYSFHEKGLQNIETHARYLQKRVSRTNYLARKSVSSQL